MFCLAPAVKDGGRGSQQWLPACALYTNRYTVMSVRTNDLVIVPAISLLPVCAYDLTFRILSPSGGSEARGACARELT